MVSADQPEAPSYFAHDAMLNRQERPTLDETLRRTLTPLGLDEVMALVQGGAQLLDVRDTTDFAGAHLTGSLNIPLSGKYATWAGTLLSRETPIVIVAEPGLEPEAAVRLGRIGFDHVAGYLERGMQALQSRPDLVQRVERDTAATLAEQLDSATAPTVLDVRTDKEWQGKRIEGSLNIPLSHLSERLDELPTDRPVVVHCASGYRSSVAVSLLQRHGLEHVADLVGGISAWEASKLKTVA